MKLLLRRGERAGTFGSPVYVLQVRAELTKDEEAWIDKYKFGKSLLYSKNVRPSADPTTLAGVGSILLHHALNITISVNDLRFGKVIECKEIVQMLAAEEQLKEAAKTFVSVLHAASQFGGEEVVEL